MCFKKLIYYHGNYLSVFHIIRNQKTEPYGRVKLHDQMLEPKGFSSFQTPTYLKASIYF